MLELSNVQCVANIILIVYGHFQITYLEDMLYQPEHFLFYANKMIHQQDYMVSLYREAYQLIKII